MEVLRKRAAELLESGEVKMVIGFEQGSENKTRAVFIDDPNQVSKLIFDSRCVQNLTVYLMKHEVKKKGKLAIVAPVPVLRSIVQLASENQIHDNEIVALAVTPEMDLLEFNTPAQMEAFLKGYALKIAERDREVLVKLEGMSLEERWSFWVKTLEPCFKCYACRAACPLCYCTQCTVDMNRPQWIPVPSHKVGNLEWHIMRAMHMAGRCTDCEACARACPIAIPLNLLTKKIITDMEESFGWDGPVLESGHAMSTFRPDDKENFIH